LIYLYEVAKVRRHKGLFETFATRSDLRLLQYDDFARYCVKMATGSGKTKVMSLTIAWQFFNAVAEARDDFAKTFLIIAPNVIVFERLRTDFEGGRIPWRPGRPAGTANLLERLPVLHAWRRRAGQLPRRAVLDQRAAVLRAAG
jgi:Type III restriction enzyme, res subunit